MRGHRRVRAGGARGACRRGGVDTAAPGPRSGRLRSPGSGVRVADQRRRLQAGRPAGHRHGDRQVQRGQPQRRQRDRGRGVGAAGLVPDRRALGGADPGPGRPGQRDDLPILRVKLHVAHRRCRSLRSRAAYPRPAQLGGRPSGRIGCRSAGVAAPLDERPCRSGCGGRPGSPRSAAARRRSPSRARRSGPGRALGQQPADGLDVLGLDRRRRTARRGLDRQPGGDPGRSVGELLDRRAVASYSSVISPTISSRMSSMVTRPAVPPYSSTTTAMWIRCRLHLPQQLVDRLGVRDERGRAHDLLDLLGSSASRCSWSRRDEVLEVGEADHVVEVLADHRDPGEAAAQGQRQGLAERLVALDEDHVGARHHHLAGDVSPSSKTEWIISRSPGSITPRCSARSTSSRSSVSVANGPVAGSPCPG